MCLPSRKRFVELCQRRGVNALSLTGLDGRLVEGALLIRRDEPPHQAHPVVAQLEELDLVLVIDRPEPGGFILRQMHGAVDDHELAAAEIGSQHLDVAAEGIGRLGLGLGLGLRLRLLRQGEADSAQ